MASPSGQFVAPCLVGLPLSLVACLVGLPLLPVARLAGRHGRRSAVLCALMRLIHRLSSEDVLGTVAGMPGLEVLYPGGFSGAVGVVVSLEVLTAVYPEPGAASAGLLAAPVPLLVAG